MAQNQQSALKGKFMIKAIMRLETGLHIGAGKDFAPIGAVDSPFIRDPFTKAPIIPGSSLKGKLRTLLARSYTDGYWLQEITKDTEQIQRLFGVANSDKFKAKAARLQFFDIKLTEESFQQMANIEMDTYIGEVKFENTINRLTAEANPRQIERVPAGAEFAFRLVYNVESETDVMEDMTLLSEGLKLLQMDYLGGSGSRGYGRVSFRDFMVEPFALDSEKMKEIQDKVSDIVEKLEGSRLS